MIVEGQVLTVDGQNVQREVLREWTQCTVRVTGRVWKLCTV